MLGVFSDLKDLKSADWDKPEKFFSNSAPNDKSYGWYYTIFFWIMFLVTIGGMAGTIISMFLIPTWSSDYTNQYLVLTAHRTRDLQEPNTYSMATVGGDDPTTRLFICMMQADIGRDNANCPIQKSPFLYRDCLIKKNKDCIAQADLNWPIDYGFQRCVISTFNPTTKQINLLTECMRHTDMIQGLAIETQNTMRFLGSYNYASLLIAATCALVSFLIFTAGGVFPGWALVAEERNDFHVTNWWAPLSMYNIIAAFVWVLVCLCASYFYMFPFPCNGCKMDLQGKQAYPSTPWTGLVSSGLFFVLLIYYGWFLVEVLWARNSKIQSGEANASIGFVTGPGTMEVENGKSLPDSNFFNTSNGNIPVYGSKGWQQESGILPPSKALPTTPIKRDQLVTVSPMKTWKDQNVWERESMGTQFKSRFFNRLGVKLATGKASVQGEEVDELMPVLIPIFATMLLFVDGPLFVGMITPQHSPLQESVALVFVGIVLARLTQVVVYKFMNKAFLSGDEVSEEKDPAVFKFRHDDPKQFALRIIVLFTYLSSLLILFVPLYHYMYRISFLNGLKAVGSNSDLVAIFFLIIVAICPEVVRSLILILMWFRFVVTSRYKFFLFQVLFAWEWISRIVFVCIALFGVPTHLMNSGNNVINLIATK